tara:strand:- start:5707 stop:6645 length:939 start_codon:yes stop_codon:yes gene_type:complete
MKAVQEIQESQKTIGNRKYHALKTYDFENMSVEDILKFKKERKMTVAQAEKEIEKYEAKFKLTEYQLKIKKEYSKKILNPETKSPKKLTAEILYNAFINRYSFIYGKDYDVQKGSDSLENLKTLLFYFTRDDRFFEQQNLIKKIDFGTKIKESKPSFSKGFILIGSYGVGKTSSMNTFHIVFKELLKLGYDVPMFRVFTTQQLAELFENCKNEEDKKTFWSNIKTGRVFFDDLKSESKASNYGIKNIMEETLQKREYMVDFVSINFAENHPENVPQALLEIGQKYGSRVFDRIFSKWNIIQFKGKSYRGVGK